jgi:hypothetical protein
MTAIVVGVLALFYLAWLGRRSRARVARGTCPRCGSANAVQDMAEASGDEGLCPRCVDTTQRNHRAAFWFFLALGPIALVLIVQGALSDIRAGFGVGWEYIPITFLSVGLPLVLAVLVRHLSAQKQ